MKRNIPIYFDNAVIMSPAEPVNGSSNINRLKVGVFTKYGNRNGSYIKDDVAQMLIDSATRGDTPVVGFFDPDSQGWASHTGPTLASAYGYVEYFDGWQPFQDTDGETRDYAVFSVVLFTRYFNEANFVVGQNQSMELDINSIEGDWANIGDTEYFVYTKAEIMGLCIIGDHEPCFSVSSFFSKKDDTYKSQYEKFSSLLADLKAKVEEAENQPKGGEHQMENVVNPEVNDPTPAQEFEAPAAEEPVNQEPEAPAAEPAAEEPAAEPEQEPAAEEPAAEPEAEEPAAEPEGEQGEEPAEEPAAEENAPAADFEAQIAELQNQLNEMTTNYENAQNQIAELQAQITSASETETALRNEIATYEAERARLEVEQKTSLIDQYATELTEEEISPIREEMNNFSLSELESKLAVCYAKKHMAGSADNKVVPLPEPVVDEFALFMEKYRKN
jgi:hypothetical protein